MAALRGKLVPLRTRQSSNHRRLPAAAAVNRVGPRQPRPPESCSIRGDACRLSYSTAVGANTPTGSAPVITPTAAGRRAPRGLWKPARKDVQMNHCSSDTFTAPLTTPLPPGWKETSIFSKTT